MRIKLVIISLFLIIQYLDVPAQNSDNTATNISYNERSYFMADLGFVNNSVFMGRSDSLSTPYLFPSFTYFNKSGFFATTSLSYLTRLDEGRVDLIWLGSGYMFDKNKWSGAFSATGYLYNNYSYNVQSQMLASIWAYVSYDFKIFRLSLTGSTTFNDNSTVDFFSGLILDRTFYVLDSNLMIMPTVSLYAGTQQFYEQYYSSNRMGSRQDRGNSHSSSGQNLPTNTVSFNEATAFKVLNVELSLPISYFFRSFIFSFTPSYAFPQSPATIISGEDFVEEELSDQFYFYVGVAYWFY